MNDHADEERRRVLNKVEMLVQLQAEVNEERRRQDKVWGEQNHPDGTGAVALVLYDTTANLDLRSGEELAEVFKQRTADAARRGYVTWRDILLEEVFEALAEDDEDKLYVELTQVEAVTRAWRENLLRKKL